LKDFQIPPKYFPGQVLKTEGKFIDNCQKIKSAFNLLTD
jgi:hypothetical protein